MGETSIVMLPFTGGLDQKAAVEYLDPTQKQAAVLNGNFDKNGSVEKRLGMTALGNSVALPSTATNAKGAAAHVVDAYAADALRRLGRVRVRPGRGGNLRACRRTCRLSGRVALQEASAVRG